MERYLEKDDVFSFKGSDYITIDALDYMDGYYILVNKLKNEELPSEVFEVFKCFDNGILSVEDETIKKEILKIFTDRLNDNLMFINEQYQVNNGGN